MIGLLRINLDTQCTVYFDDRGILVAVCLKAKHIKEYNKKENDHVPPFPQTIPNAYYIFWSHISKNLVLPGFPMWGIKSMYFLSLVFIKMF